MMGISEVRHKTGIKIVQYYNITILHNPNRRLSCTLGLAGCTALRQSQFIRSSNQGNILRDIKQVKLFFFYILRLDPSSCMNMWDKISTFETV